METTYVVTTEDEDGEFLTPDDEGKQELSDAVDAMFARLDKQRESEDKAPSAAMAALRSETSDNATLIAALRSELTEMKANPPIAQTIPVTVNIPAPIVNITNQPAEVSVNVPQQAAPVVNVAAAEVPKPKRETQSVTRDKNGDISGSTTNIEY